MNDDLLSKAAKHAWWHIDQQLRMMTSDIVERLRVQIAEQTNCVTVKDSPSNAVVIIKQRDAIRAANEIERLSNASDLDLELISNMRDEIERLRKAFAMRERDHCEKTSEAERLHRFASWIIEAYDSDEWPAQKDIVAGAREALGDE